MCKRGITLRLSNVEKYAHSRFFITQTFERLQKEKLFQNKKTVSDFAQTD